MKIYNLLPFRNELLMEKPKKPFIDWTSLKNPVYDKIQDNNWSVKDACVEYKPSNRTFYLLFSAFYEDRGEVRSHVIGVRTKDWRGFSEPFMHIDGREEGWTGMCSPNITRIVDKKKKSPRYVITFNSWGKKHPNGRKDSLFFIESKDMENWSKPVRLVENIHEDIQKIDIAVAFANKKYYVAWKESSNAFRTFWYRLTQVFRKPEKRFQHRKAHRWTLMGTTRSLPGDVCLIGKDGMAQFHMKNGEKSTKIQENYQMINIDGKWRLLSSDYKPKVATLYTMDGDGTKDGDWLLWTEGYDLDIPVEKFNTNHTANAPFLADWREYDGFFYLLYAGRNQNTTHKGRGNNKLGLARSKDLIHWDVP